MMTCKELVIYILENNLLNEPVFDGERFVGFITDGDAAEELKIGPASLDVLLNIYEVECVDINGVRFVPYDFADAITCTRKE